MDNFELARGNFQDGLSLLKRQDFVAAEEKFRSALALMPERVSVLVNLSATLIRLGKYAEAKALATRALGIDDREADGWVNLAICLHAESKFDEALAACDRALRANPIDPLVHHMLGNLLCDLGQLEKALASYEQAIRLKPDYADAYYNLAITLQDMKRLDEALENYDQAIRLNAGYPGAHNNRGITLHLLKRFDKALASFDEAIKLEADDAQVHNNRGNTLRELKRFDEALASYDRAIQLNADYAQAYNNRGVTLGELDRFEEAIASCNQAIKLNPDYAEAYSNRGNALQELKKLEAALASHDQAIHCQPGYAGGHINRGITLQELKRFDEALGSFERASALDPDSAAAHYNRGNALLELRRFDEALACFNRALAIDSALAESCYGRGNAQKMLGQLPAALASYEQATRMKPEHAQAWCNRGAVLEDLGQHDAALASLARSIELKPDNARAYSNLAMVQCNLGDLRAGIESLRKSLRIDPGIEDTHSGLIFHLDLLADADTAAQQQERKLWNQRHAEPLLKARDYSNDPDPRRPLRIGYVSGDFNHHSAASAFVALLEDFDRSAFQVVAYSNSPLSDAFTTSIRSRVTLWRDIYPLADEAAADLILEDRIDILVDLSGHTRGNRLLVFARKPAPVQVSAIGYPTGTGMRAVDALFADAVVVPPGERQFYAEDVRYLPSVTMYSRDASEFPPVNELPALSSAVVTFGAFNRIVKITAETLALWARLLQALPQSALILKAAQFDDQTVRQRLLEPFSKAGIAAERVRILGKTTWVEHVRVFNRVDIALDTLPHGGGVTTLEGIMMGVPVVTLRWPSFAGRASASILTTLGLTDWIAESQDQYIRIAIEKARNLEALAALRRRLRAVFAASLFGNPAASVKALEDEYRKLWQEWCAGRNRV